MTTLALNPSTNSDDAVADFKRAVGSMFVASRGVPALTIVPPDDPLGGGRSESATAVPFNLNARFLMVEDHFPVGFPEGEV